MSMFSSAWLMTIHDWLLRDLSKMIQVKMCPWRFRGQKGCRVFNRRLAWALVAGGGSWCLEAVARREIALRGTALRQEIFSHLDAWLHANSYSSRTLYAALLDRLKVATTLRAHV
jgi:hypothetical protein